MSSKYKFISFTPAISGGDTAFSYTGLSPIITRLQGVDGVAVSVPTVVASGATLGFYGFTALITSQLQGEIDFGTGISSSRRYIQFALDPIMKVDAEIGNTTDTYGTSSVDPDTLHGKANRTQEFLEGNAIFNKSSLSWSVYSRGSTTLLMTRTLTNTSSQATKS
jgi:hypothetical protein